MIRSIGQILLAVLASALAAPCAFAIDAAPVAADKPAVANNAAADPAAIEFFETNVRPVLAEKCFRCHSDEAAKPKGKLKLNTRDAILAGGNAGAAIVPGDAEKSLLVHAIRYADKDLQMPPKERLGDEQIQAIETWIAMGAPFPADAQPATAPAAQAAGPVAMTVEQGRLFWSFKQPVEPALPEVKSTGWVKSPIDRFILSRLEARQLSASQQAGRRTLIRRATYDLTGLPPTAQEVAAFEADTSSDAFERVLDRLLASPRYGERWGRYWLDVARYADTKGYVFQEERRYAFSYTYRDWVIRAFNEDLPYDQFLIQQIAADKLELGEDKRPLAALGFLTVGRRFLNNRHDIIDDRIDVISRGTMGLTVSCARCHDHKYDPIPTADYYSLYGVFASSKEPKELPLIEPAAAPEASSPVRKEFTDELARRISAADAEEHKRVDAHMASLRSPAVLTNYLLAVNESAGLSQGELDVLCARRGINIWVLGRWRSYLDALAKNNDALLMPGLTIAACKQEFWPLYQLNAFAQSARIVHTSEPRNLSIALAIASLPPATPQQLSQRYADALASRNREQPFDLPGDEALRLVLRGTDSPTLLAATDKANFFTVEDDAAVNGLRQQVDALVATHPGSPPRAMVLEDLPEPLNPKIFRRGNPGNIGDDVPRQFLAVLSPAQRQPFPDGGRLELAKLIASRENPLTARVMVNRVWLHHFGAGLVRTPSDFGTRGEKPTHPELLDWLAIRFMNEDGWSIKKLHKRIMLSAAYQQMSFGNPDAAEVDPENRLLWRQNAERLDFEAMRDSLLAASGQLDSTMGGRSVDILARPFAPRRTVYAFIDRQNLPGMFRTFDFASPDATNAQRPNTSVPQQALFMMNSPFAIEQARKLVARADVASESDAGRRVAAMYRASLAREARPEEVALGLKFIETEAQQPVEPEVKPSNWQYGYGEIDDATQRIKSFTELPHFDGTVWSGGEKRPDDNLGWTMLAAHGGHPGRTQQHATIRRWVAPRDCTVSIKGAVSHKAKDGDGVRARIVTPREGVVAQWIVLDKEAGTRVTAIAVKQGETVDFVVDAGRANDDSFDAFAWKVVITKEPTPDALAGDDTGSAWDSNAEFAGPTQHPEPLSPWEKYAQVLLQSNEFAFVD